MKQRSALANYELCIMYYELTKYFRGALFCLCFALAAAGCSMSDDLDCPPEGGLANSGKTYIRLSFAMPGSGSTRATGGELGNGQEAGQNEENTISSAVAFLYKADETDDKGVNADGETRIAAVVEFNDLTGPDDGADRPDSEHYIDKVYTKTQEVPGIVEYGKYNVIVAANLKENLPSGESEWWHSPQFTLGDVRDHILTKAWDETPNGESTTYSNFLMTNEADAEITLSEKNTSDNPAKTTVDVERVAARVDYKTNGTYEITGDGTTANGTITITGAYIVNRLDAGSYFLKRVTVGKDVNANVTYLGDETASNGVATNYVIDPWTTQKTGKEMPDLYAPDTYFPNGSDDPEDWDGWCKEGDEVTDPDNQSEVWRRVGYCMENTTASDATMKQYNTGIVFRAKFDPEPTDVEDYTSGQTFFTYDGKIYPMLTDMMGQLNNKADFSNHVDKSINTIENLNNLTVFTESLANDPTGYCEYLKDYVNSHPHMDFTNTEEKEKLKWGYYLNNIIGVIEDSQEGPQINKNKVKTRQFLYEKSGGRIRTYYKGQCYYIWWLRHSDNDDDTTNGIMEYAVVRNNIYKLNVTGVSSLGGDIPNVEGLVVHVYVHDWVMLDGETLPM